MFNQNLYVMSKTTNTLIGFIAGAAAGAITGILFAPDKGYKTRKRVKKKAKKIKTDAQREINDKMDDLKEQMSEMVDDMKGKYADAESEMKAKMGKIKNQVDKNKVDA